MHRLTVLGSVLVTGLSLSTREQPPPAPTTVASAAHAESTPPSGDLIGPARVDRGASFTLTGSFAARSRATVTLQSRPGTGPWRAIRTTTSSRRGIFTFGLHASRRSGTTDYRAVILRPPRAALRTGSWRVTVTRAGHWEQLSPGSFYSCGVKTDHTAWCWGRDLFGQLGNGDAPGGAQPQPLPGSWQSLSTSNHRSTCGIQLDGSGWCWGYFPGNGQTLSDVPVRLDGQWRTLRPTSIPESSGDDADYTCGIRTDDSLWCWGDNYDGVLGVGESRYWPAQLTPRQVPGQWRELQNAGTTQCGIRTDGTGWCWGANYRGQVGDGTMVNRTSPVELPGTWTSLTTMAVGVLPDEHTCGVRTDATAWCWGDNSLGQLGDGTTTQRLTPTQLPGAWRVLDPSSDTVCGVATDESGWCWGANAEGQVGNGTTRPQLSPYPLAGTWDRIATRDGTSCGVQVDGAGWCWGANADGGVGNGTTRPRLTPYRLRGTWTDLQPGRSSCGIRTDDTGWCWGANQNGMAGRAPFVDRLTPGRLRGRWSGLVGYLVRCGIHLDGTAACWGENRYGQAGTGVKSEAAVPTVLP